LCNTTEQLAEAYRSRAVDNRDLVRLPATTFAAPETVAPRRELHWDDAKGRPPEEQGQSAGRSANLEVPRDCRGCRRVDGLIPEHDHLIVRRPDGRKSVGNPETAINSPGRRGGKQMEHGIIAWLVIGAVAGWLAGKVVEGGGFGLIIDIVVGIVGALIGGYLAGALGIAIGGGMISSIIVAVIGAVVLLIVLRFIKRAL
jgi:uncharacterized membrane protein YeaQ/YmgE (transglycosylase-associated protein family)